MDRSLIEDKLESLRRCVKRIESKRPDAPEELANDPDLQDIVALNLTRAVQLCVDIAAHIIADSDVELPQTMAETFDRLAAQHVLTLQQAESMQKAVGFRNIAVHNYRKIDWQIVFWICHHQLSDFKDFAAAIVKAMNEIE
jgi:uncharacterized protein YutE (UPF0331/DUF86 family)